MSWGSTQDGNKDEELRQSSCTAAHVAAFSFDSVQILLYVIVIFWGFFFLHKLKKLENSNLLTKRDLTYLTFEISQNGKQQEQLHKQRK